MEELKTVLKLKNHINQICEAVCNCFGFKEFFGEIDLMSNECHFFTKNKEIDIRIDYYKLENLHSEIVKQMDKF